MRKSIATILAGAMALTMFSGAAFAENATEAATEAVTEFTGTPVEVEKLSVAFVPSREPEEIITATEPLKDLLKDQLAKLGYNVGEVDITVGTSYDAVGQAMVAGTTDIGVIPGGTYALYDDGCDVILTATRNGLSNDFDDAKSWNENKPTTASENQAVSYRGLMIAGPSEKGRELAEKVNNGEELTWEDVDSANWSIMSSTSSAGYIYPSLWLNENFGKNVTELSHAVQADDYGSAFGRLATGDIDVLCTYADARRDYETKWNEEYSMENSIWDDTDVIGVTPAIYNDTISVSKNSPVMLENEGLKDAIATAFMKIAETDEGKEVIAIYSHNGYQPAKSEDYDNERAAQKMILEMAD